MKGGWVGKGEEMEGRALIYIKQVQLCLLAQLSHAMNQPLLYPQPLLAMRQLPMGMSLSGLGSGGVSKVMALVVSHQ